LHSAIGCSPFEALYGYSPHRFGLVATAACPSAVLSDWLHEKHTIQSLIHQQLLHAQRLMKFQADKHRSKHTFAVGSWIYLKLQPHVLSSVAPCANQKLAYKFFGPFLIAYLIILRYIQSFMCHS
jgi:hypothetical protein